MSLRGRVTISFTVCYRVPVIPRYSLTVNVRVNGTVSVAVSDTTSYSVTVVLE